MSLKFSNNSGIFWWSRDFRNTSQMLPVIHEIMIEFDLKTMLDALKRWPTCKKTVYRVLDKLVNEFVTRLTATPEIGVVFTSQVTLLWHLHVGNITETTLVMEIKNDSCCFTKRVISISLLPDFPDICHLHLVSHSPVCPPP